MSRKSVKIQKGPLKDEARTALKLAGISCHMSEGAQGLMTWTFEFNGDSVILKIDKRRQLGSVLPEKMTESVARIFEVLNAQEVAKS